MTTSRRRSRKPSEHFGRLRSALKAVAKANDRIRRRGSKIVQHGIERHGIAMDVGDGGEFHRGQDRSEPALTTSKTNVPLRWIRSVSPRGVNEYANLATTVYVPGGAAYGGDGKVELSRT